MQFTVTTDRPGPLEIHKVLERHANTFGCRTIFRQSSRRPLCWNMFASKSRRSELKPRKGLRYSFATMDSLW